MILADSPNDPLDFTVWIALVYGDVQFGWEVTFVFHGFVE